MKIEVKVDSTDIFPHLYEGSVLHDVKVHGRNYIGIFSSFMGSYEVEIPKKRCRKINPKTDISSIERMISLLKCKKK